MGCRPTEMSEYLKTSELTESRSFIQSFVKEIVVEPGKAAVRYTIPISQSTPNNLGEYDFSSAHGQRRASRPECQVR